MRKRIFSEGVADADPSVLTMDEKFGSLIPRNLSTSRDCFLLGFKCPGHPVCSGFANTPFAVPRHDMLTFGRHRKIHDSAHF